MHTTVPALSKIVLPLSKGRCKKCRGTIYWGKSKQTSKFFPPFGDPNAASWHHCSEATATQYGEATSEQFNEAIKQHGEQQATAHEREEKKKARRVRQSFTEYTVEELSGVTAQYINQLRNYARPTV